MNDQRLEHEIREALDEAAPPMPPDKLLHTFEQKASHTRRRPRWLAHSKEPPMYYDRRLAVGSPQVRMVSIMAATLMLILSLAAVGAGIYNLLQDEIVVDQSGNGDYLTIREAVEAAKDGTSILVMPGTYIGWFEVDDDVSIRGVGERSEIVIAYDHSGQVRDADWGFGIRLNDVDAAISNLEIRGPSGGPAIMARGGSLDLENVRVDPGADGLRSSASGSIRNVELHGVLLDGASDVTIEDSSLICFVRVAGSTDVSFARVAFRDSDACPPLPGHDSSPNLPMRRDNDFGIHLEFLPHVNGVRVEAASPTFSDSTFELPMEILGTLIEASTGGPRFDLWVHADPPPVGAAPVIEDSTFAELETAILVDDAARPQIRNNRFTDNGLAVVVRKSNAIIEGNRVTGGRSGFALTAAKPELTGNTVEDIVGPAVSIVMQAGPILRDNVLCAEGTTLEIADTATPDIDDSNQICDGSAERLVVDVSGNGDFVTIQEAHDAARDGSRIDVMPGTYTGYLDITKNVRIRGVGDRSDVVLDYTPDDEAASREFGLWFNGTNASLSNLEVRGPAVSTAIEVDGGTLDLEDVLVHPGPESLNTTGGGIISRVELRGPSRFGTDSTLTVRKSSLWCFVQVASSDAVFTDSTFRYDAELCPRSPSRLGRHTAAPNGTLLPGESGDAVMIEAASPTFTGNTFELPLQVFGVTPDVWTENPDRIVRPGRIGAEPVIEGNTFRGLGTAISVNQTARPQVRGNDFVDNGVAVEVEAALATIEDNTVSSGGSGFVLTAASPDLTRNIVEGVTGPAVSITGSATPILRENVLCAIGETMAIAETASPDIDDSNQICLDSIVVAPDGSGDFATIGEAIDAARDGTSIDVMPGTYNEHLDVTKNVSISGVGAPEDVTIAYDHEGQTDDVWGYGIRLRDVDASISNLGLRGPVAGTAIVARGGGLALENVVVYPGPRALELAASGSLRNVEFWGPTTIWGDHDITVEASRLYCRVRVAGTDRATFRGTAFLHDAEACPEDDATLLDRRRNRDGVWNLPGDPAPYFPGLRIEAASPTFIDNTFSIPTEIRGSLMPELSTGAFDRLDLYDDPPSPGARPVIEGNSYQGLDVAITVADTATAQIRGNDFEDNTIAVAVARSNPIIEDNTVTGGETGFVLTAVKPQLTGNTVEGATGPAVAITGSAAPILRQNVLCSDGEVLSIADTATPDIDDSNEICE